jgi:hypothetical protein
MTSKTLELQPIQLEPIETIHVHEPLDIAKRLNELSQLEHGWLDGDGKALDTKELQWLTACFDRFFWSGVPLPYLCPTIEGGIFAEWVSETKDNSLEINLNQHTGHWHSLNHQDQTFTEQDLDLNSNDSWNWLCEQILQQKNES